MVGGRHLAPPPESFDFLGRTLTPRQFADEVLEIDPDDYVEVTSYESIPFYGKGEVDWGDVGAGWNDAGIAVIHPDMTSPLLIGQDSRGADFLEHRTTDDHLVHAVDHRVVDGRDWYLVKNSHGTDTGRRGYVWMRDDRVAVRVLFHMLHRDAGDPGVLARFAN